MSNVNTIDFPRDLCIDQLIGARAERTPDAVAVVFAGRTLTYRQLDERSSALARGLRARGVEAGATVGLCAERSLEMIIGMLGILKAGAAYVPLDPRHPRARLLHVVRDAGTALVLLHGATAMASLPGDVAAVEIGAVSDGPPFPDDRTSQSPAYVMYTSGSTGEPKGVQVSHRAVVNFLCSMRRCPGLGASDVVLAITTIAFDIAGLEIYLPLTVGARIELASTEDAVDGARLVRKLAAARATVMQATPSTWRLLLATGWEGDGGLRMLCGGEALTRELADALLDRGAELWNLYGPTETTIWSTLQRVERGRGPVVIGRPIANTQVYVLGADRHPVVDGEPGELYIGGEGLALGYLGRPELTEQRFCRVASLDGARLYRTGDRVRVAPGGALEYLGRLDDQVKIRGHRIELGEVEATLRAHPSVHDAVVVVREDSSGDPRLIGYVVPGAVSAAKAAQLRSERPGQWGEVYDRVYAASPADAPADLDIAGWRSSYTGEPLSAGVMRRWRDATVRRIEGLEPARILEIGCGSGMLLTRLAPRATSYVGTDVSGVAIARLQGRLAGLPQVELRQREARDFSGLAAGSFDVALINSVAQYFTDIEYLRDVVREAVRVVRPSAAGRHGVVFVGDVRSLPLLLAFRGSVELARAGAEVPATTLRDRAVQAAAAEPELSIDPQLFVDLGEELPEIAAVDVLLRRGAGDDEMTRFRYDVLLHVGPPVADAAPVSLRWPEDGLAAVERRLVGERPLALELTGVPNRRVAGDNHAWARMQDSGLRAGELRSAAVEVARRAIDPEALFELGDRLGYSVRVTWSLVDPSCVDALFERTPAALRRWRRPRTDPPRRRQRSAGGVPPAGAAVRVACGAAGPAARADGAVDARHDRRAAADAERQGRSERAAGARDAASRARARARRPAHARGGAARGDLARGPAPRHVRGPRQFLRARRALAARRAGALARAPGLRRRAGPAGAVLAPDRGGAGRCHRGARRGGSGGGDPDCPAW
jgi:amino acid adenylation domain-containing protein